MEILNLLILRKFEFVLEDCGGVSLLYDILKMDFDYIDFNIIGIRYIHGFPVCPPNGYIVR